MSVLFTSDGVLIDLLGTPMSESRTVVVLDAMLPFAGDRATGVLVGSA